MAAQEAFGPMSLVLQREKGGHESRGQRLEDGTAKEMDSPLEPAERNTAC